MKHAMVIAAGVIVFVACAAIATHSWTTQSQSREYWTDPNTGERIEILKSRPIHTTLRDRFMLIDQN
jgi:hypothetical protein